MMLRGVVERALGGFICIRGYARIGDLVVLSSSEHANYQRSEDKEQKEKLSEFFKPSQGLREYLYFPEITLAYTLNKQLDNIAMLGGEFLLSMEPHGGRAIRFAMPKAKSYKTEQDKRQLEYFHTININIHGDVPKDGYFTRIDGNHRLLAAATLSVEEKDNLLTPFCLILFNDDLPSQKQQSVLFHNINAKVKPLTLEENLKGIFESNQFTNDELTVLGWEYAKTAKILQQLNLGYLSSLHNLLKLRKHSTLFEVVKFLAQHSVLNEGTTIEEFLKNLATINNLYQNEARLQACHEQGLFYALMYYAFKAKDNEKNLLTGFKSWVLRNHIDKIKHIDATSIVDVFDQVHASQLKIFMAMPYYSDEGVDNYNTALKNAVNAIIGKNPNINLMHHPIMRTRSPTHDVIADIMNKIQYCDIFIADITENNANVSYEYGVARGYQKPCILLRKKTAKSPVKSDYANDLRFEFEGDFDLQTNLQKQIEGVLIELGLEVNHEPI